ncbi:MAG: hypothetical protein J6A01_05550, partial [Proteobacteria bacterium]|nr:hypothetical protein [Pseudomonadota bacterium]
KGTPLAIPGAQPGFKYHFEFLDESCNHKTSNWYDEYFFTNMISEPQLPQTKEEYENASTIPSHTRIYPSSLPMGKNNAFTIKAYQELFAKKIEVLNQILGEAEVTVYLTDEYMNLAKDIPDYHFEDIHVYMCTKKCTELILKRQEQNAFTYFVPKQYYGEDTGVYIYAGSHNTTKDAIKVVILPDYLKRLKIILTILFIIGAIVGTITIKNRIYFNKILPPLPGPNDDLKDHIIQYVNTVYKELFNKKMDKTSEPAKLLYQEAESMNISNLKSLDQYCMLIHTALKNEITKETIKTIRKETIKIIKKTKPES